MSELNDEEVPDDPLGLLHPFPDLVLTQVSELKDEEVPEDSHGLLQPPSRYGPHPGK